MRPCPLRSEQKRNILAPSCDSRSSIRPTGRSASVSARSRPRRRRCCVRSACAPSTGWRKRRARPVRRTVLVAGDVFDSETVSDALIGTLLARLKAHPKLTWHLLPGNHDPARAGGVWEAIVGAGLPGKCCRAHRAARRRARCGRGAAAGAAHRQEHEPRSDGVDGCRRDARRHAAHRPGARLGAGLRQRGRGQRADRSRTREVGAAVLSGARRLARHHAHLRARVVLGHARARQLSR